MMYFADTGYILLGTNFEYDITCCGVIASWQAYIDTTGPVDLYFQVWRPQSGTYLLVGENHFVAG